MNFFKELGKKNWIDWVKLVVAVDIASVGIGLIFGFNFHVLAYFLGFLSRFMFGLMYVFVAILIMKRIFPEFFINDEVENTQEKESHIDEDIKDGINKSKSFFKQSIESLDLFLKKMTLRVDAEIDRLEVFFKKRFREAKKEIQRLLKK